MINKIDEKATILAIDDTADILGLIREILMDEYNLKLINSPKKALEFLKTNPKIDLILLDVMMPEIDGYELGSIIKDNIFYSQTPIIFLTALEKTTDILRGFECGAVDYVTKPFIPELLKARIRVHIDLKRLHDKVKEDLREKEMLLYKQSRMTTLGEMFENVTHQWKQPLSIISMSCSGLKISCEFDEIDAGEVLKTIDMVSSEVEYLAKTIDHFRDFARDDIEKEEFDFKDILEHAINILSFRFAKTNIDIVNNIQSIKYRAYKNYAIQLFINILNNAIDALEKNGNQKWIKASSLVEENRVVIRICDSAQGIKIDNIETVFEKYFTTKDNEQVESGLGLYISKQIIDKKFDGKICVHNEKDGACFELIFPIKDEEE